MSPQSAYVDALTLDMTVFEIRPLKMKLRLKELMGGRGGVANRTGVPLRRGRDRRDVLTWRTQGKGATLQAKERGRGRTRTCGHLDLGHPASRAVRESISEL